MRENEKTSFARTNLLSLWPLLIVGFVLASCQQNSANLGSNAPQHSPFVGAGRFKTAAEKDAYIRANGGYGSLGEKIANNIDSGRDYAAGL